MTGVGYGCLLYLSQCNNRGFNCLFTCVGEETGEKMSAC